MSLTDNELKMNEAGHLSFPFLKLKAYPVALPLTCIWSLVTILWQKWWWDRVTVQLGVRALSRELNCTAHTRGSLVIHKGKFICCSFLSFSPPALGFQAALQLQVQGGVTLQSTGKSQHRASNSSSANTHCSEECVTGLSDHCQRAFSREMPRKVKVYIQGLNAHQASPHPCKQTSRYKYWFFLMTFWMLQIFMESFSIQ